LDNNVLYENSTGFVLGKVEKFCGSDHKCVVFKCQSAEELRHINVIIAAFKNSAVWSS